MIRNRRKLIHNIGVNNADYDLYKTAKVDGKWKLLWSCPFYKRWVGMLERCYSEKFHITNPTYKGCTTDPEWHYFMTFRAWMIEQDWEGKQLDKDILFPGNKVYSAATCCFVSKQLNLFLLENSSSRGEWPIGVYYLEKRNLFTATCSNAITGKKSYLGYFRDPESAHAAWLTEKIRQAKILASYENDPRIALAIVNRYENYV